MRNTKFSILALTAMSVLATATATYTYADEPVKLTVSKSVQPTAPTVPAIDTTATKITSADEWNNLVKAPPQAKVSYKTQAEAEQALTASYDAGKISSLPPIAGDDGSVLYPYGQSWPTVVCAPLQVCVIQLGEGDKPAQVVLGQPGMWSLTQALAGDTPLLAISPRFKDLHTNLMVTAQARDGTPRVYYVNLVSDNAKYIPKIGFYYPTSINQAWALNAQANRAKAEGKSVATQRAKDQTVASLPSLDASKLDFKWSAECADKSGWFQATPDCTPIKPTRIFDDGVHTYLQMPSGLGDTAGLPTIMATNSAGQPAIINYRFKSGYYVIDGVPEQINLVAGNGDGSTQRVVKITHGE